MTMRKPSAKDFAEAVNVLARKTNAIAPELRRAGFVVNRTDLSPASFESAAGEVYDALESQGPVEGWIWRAGEPPAVFEDWSTVQRVGTPLRAEVLCADGRSCHLDHQEGLFWSLRLIGEVETGEAGPLTFADDVVILGREIVAGHEDDDARSRTFQYSRFWIVDEGGAVRLAAARFTGFGVEGEDA